MEAIRFQRDLLRSADCRAKINGTLYAYQKWMVGSKVSVIRVDNSEGEPGNSGSPNGNQVGYAAKLPDVAEGRARLVSATSDDAAGSERVQQGNLPFIELRKSFTLCIPIKLFVFVDLGHKRIRQRATFGRHPIQFRPSNLAND